MTGIFGGGTAAKSQRQQQKYATSAIKSANKNIDYKPIQSDLQAEQTRLAHGGFYPTNFAGPSYGINIDNSGNIGLNRTGETQGFMDRLLSGMGADEAGYSGLLSQIAPGFGDLSKASVQSIRNSYEQAYGNLREQLAKRRVLGASFANDQLTGVRQAQAEAEQKAAAEAKVQELQLTQQVLQDRANTRNQAIQTGLSQVQFEGDIGSKLVQMVSASMQNLTALQTDLVKTGALIQADLQKAKAGNATTIGNTVTGSFPEYASLASQEAAGPGQLIGTIGGALLGGPFGASLGGALGGSLFGGGSSATLRFPSGATSVGPGGATF